MRVKRMTKDEAMDVGLSRFPNFHVTGNVTGMKRLYYGEGALLVRCGSFIYNVSNEPNIYKMAH